MKSAIATLALAASVSAFAPAPVTKSSTALNDVWDSYSEFFIAQYIYHYYLEDFLSSNSTVAPFFPSFDLCVPNLHI